MYFSFSFFVLCVLFVVVVVKWWQKVTILTIVELFFPSPPPQKFSAFIAVRRTSRKLFLWRQLLNHNVIQQLASRKLFLCRSNFWIFSKNPKIGNLVITCRGGYFFKNYLTFLVSNSSNCSFFNFFQKNLKISRKKKYI